MRARILINKGLKKQVRFARIKGLDEHMFDSRVPRRSVIYPRIFGDVKLRTRLGPQVDNTRCVTGESWAGSAKATRGFDKLSPRTHQCLVDHANGRTCDWVD